MAPGQNTDIPAHIAIIMDGNGRWAKARGLPRSQGHQAGVEAAKAVVTRCREIGVRHLTLYTFSRENWFRPKDEVAFLFDLLARFLNRELGSLLEQDIQLRVLGDIARLPFATRKVVEHVAARTKGCGSMVLNLALNYSSRDEIIRACRNLAAKGLDPGQIDEAAFAAELYTAGQPDPDLVIRTSGELRLSNYLLYQVAYSEFYFTDVLWPDFSPDKLDTAVEEYQRRQRRFGRTGEQID
ncbi:MAG: isoprenyl transferase [Desulfovibrionaceae bacterium]|nr:isoprenyl transferase [Desulfovibrionaceae bacterium]MDD4951792.1 isoprenyl transferase [Desulfovibrionaceae bacterium]